MALRAMSVALLACHKTNNTHGMCKAELFRTIHMGLYYAAFSAQTVKLWLGLEMFVR